jgi:branched-chain amino acid transport system permease protein
VAIIALVALLPNGLAGLPAQLRQRRAAHVAAPSLDADTARAAPKPDAAHSSRQQAPARLPIQGEPHV